MQTLTKFLVIAEHESTGELFTLTITATDEEHARAIFRTKRREQVQLFHFHIQTIFPVVL